jgi:pyruvate dehydrogenase E2 component (dihydrolipoamide acetyltransferase)
MPTEFLMPKLGLTMEEGTIVTWLVADGSDVSAGTPVMLIETDKTETEVEAPTGGRISRAADEGQTFPCGAVVAWFLAEGEEPPTAVSSHVVAPAPAVAAAQGVSVGGGTVGAAESSSNGRRFVSPNARRVAAQLGVDLDDVRGTGPGGRIVSEDVEEAATRGHAAPVPSTGRATSAAITPGASFSPPSTAAPSGTAQPATAAARQLADLLGVDLGAVAPDPIERYITREGVARYVRERLRVAQPPAPAAAGAPPAAAAVPVLQTPVEVRRMSGMRGTIAKRMHASLQEMAQLTLTMDADVGAVVADRERRKSEGGAPGFTDYVVAAAARALREHPVVNSQMTQDGIAFLPEIHVGLAVALTEGLVVPVVRNANRLRLSDLSAETTRLADAARAGKLAVGDLEGGTFSVSALGMFGVDVFTPVINPPNVAILGVGRMRDDLALVDGQVTTAKRLTLSLTWDHRVLDGAPAAAFCQTIVRLLADPALLD